MNQSPENKPLLASLVQAGDQQHEAEPLTDFIFMAKGISNAYLVTTDAGDVMINTGFMDHAERTQRLLEPRRTGALHYVVLTQAHADHYGGVPTLKEPATRIIGGPGFNDTWEYFHDLAPYLARRSAKLWSGTVKRGTNPPPPPEISIDITANPIHVFELGNREFQIISTPGGETTDSVIVWMPKERTVFTGNLFGPVFLAMPNLVTIRGDKPRLVQRYLKSLETVRDLNADLLITGHGDPIREAANIRASLDKMHAAVSYVNQAVIAGMNAGKTVHTLMQEIQLPAELKIGEYHGKVAWAVRSIWEEYSGWFHYDSTTSLYATPRSSVDSDLVELAGGPKALVERARLRLDQGRALEALHLLDIALQAHPDQQDALAVKKDVLQVLLHQSGGQNLSETMWLKSEVAAATARITAK